MFRIEGIMKLFSNYFFRWFIAGFTFGLLASVIYLWIEGPPFLFVPEWVQIAGFPGIASGWWFYEHIYNGNNFRAEVFGCVINGLSYGVVFLVLGTLIRKFRKNN